MKKTVKTAKKQYTAEEKKAYFAQKKHEAESALIEGVKHCYTEGNFRNYLDTMRKFHNYSVNNCMLIAMQMPDASFVAGFNDWKNKFKRTVKKGEHGIKILAPLPCKFTKQVEDEDGNTTEETVEFMRFRVVSVFDYRQTEGQPLPQICNTLTASVEDYDSIIDTLKNIANVPVTFEPISNGAYGYFNTVEKKIVVKENMPQAQTIKTLIHEIAHSILHDDAFIDIPRDVKEIQAESVAYMVCQNIGIDTADYSFEYVAAWAHEDMKKLTDQMTIVKKTAEALTESIQKGAF